MTEDKPLLLVDIDGVLNFFGPHTSNFHWSTFIGGYPMNLDLRHPQILTDLEPHFDVHWATMWQAKAPSMFAPVFGWGTHIPYIDFDSHIEELAAAGKLALGVSGVGHYKLAGITALAEDRPLVWIDDDGNEPAVRKWAEKRNRHIPTLVVTTDPYVGMTKIDVNQIMAFARTLVAV